MPLTVSPTAENAVSDLRALVLSVVPTNTPVLIGLANRVATPLPLTGFVYLTPIHQERLEWNTDTLQTSPAAVKLIQMAMRLDVQIDCYGPLAADWATMIHAVYFDEYACDLMVNSQPLFMASEPQMAPLVDSEAQYEQRWTMTAAMQFNPVVQPAQLYADALDITLVNVQETY
jgi:hypothetical protein